MSPEHLCVTGFGKAAGRQLLPSKCQEERCLNQQQLDCAVGQGIPIGTPHLPRFWKVSRRKQLCGITPPLLMRPRHRVVSPLIQGHGQQTPGLSALDPDHLPAEPVPTRLLPTVQPTEASGASAQASSSKFWGWQVPPVSLVLRVLALTVRGKK